MAINENDNILSWIFKFSETISCINKQPKWHDIKFEKRCCNMCYVSTQVSKFLNIQYYIVFLKSPIRLCNWN